MSDGSERRLHTRVDANLVVRSRALDLSELPLLASGLGKDDPAIPPLNLLKTHQRVTQFTSVNLSLGGFSVNGDLTLNAEKPYSHGSDVVLEFDLLDGKTPVRAVAQVMWVRPDEDRHQMGLMFLLIAHDSYERIQAFVHRHIKE
jgi:Tfp pilus assembly protein PilZ